MKSDTERKRYHTEPLHRRKGRMHAHLSKELRSRLKSKKRAISLRKGDTVKVMRGPHKGKEAKVGDVNVVRRKVFLEGVVVSNARGREVPIALEASNLLLVSLESTPERKEIFSEEAFRKKEPPKKEAPKAEAKESPAAEGKPAPEGKAAEQAKEHKPHEEHAHKPEAKEHAPVNRPQEAHKEHRPAHSK
jgi:large subunit ribosomal protein L24